MPAKVFSDVVDCIFKNKPRTNPSLTYSQLTDEDKEDNFFMINRKFSYQYINHADLFNRKGIDKISAIDLWNYHFRKVMGTPPWYWKSSTAKVAEEKGSKKLPKTDKELLMLAEELSEEEYNFLEKYCKTDLTKELKKLKKFNV